MRNLQNLAVVSSLAIGSLAAAQNAVEWRVADGGNGHWYERIARNDQSWTALRALCEARGGHLVSITSAAESSMAVAVMAGQSCIIGGFQDRKASNYLEPAGGWRWCTNEPIGWSNWNQAEPNNAPGLGEDIMAAYPSGLWVDLSNLSGDVGWPVSFAIIEYEADCNNDGIVDYTQCRDGSLPDFNGNNIPDCCEQGSACIVGNYPVQWRVADGGNGHWYEAVVGSSCVSWSQSRDSAAQSGGYLVTVTSTSESAFVRSHFAGFCFIGLFQDRTSPLYSEPDGGWRWVSGEPFGFANWNTQPGEASPNNANGDEDFAHLNLDAEGTWNDVRDNWCAPAPYTVSSIIEWSADCNADGLIDYGQILAGSLPDSNQNNIPDCCEGGASCNPCPGDVDNSGAVNGVDLAAILNTWGTGGGKYPGADVNHDGIVNGTDLAEVLNGWGPCH